MKHGIGHTKEWFKFAIPEPTKKNITTQLGCHFEEMVEMIGALHGNDRITQSMLTQAFIVLHGLALHLKSDDGNCIEVIDRLEILDGLTDQLVTATGVAHMLRFDIEGALAEVNRSNFSKFVDGKPFFDANYKIIKGPHYFKPDLTPFI